MPHLPPRPAIQLPGRIVLCLVALAASVPTLADATSRAPVVAAAASVRFALEELAEEFHRQTHQRVRISVGSSGNLARQIREGAPYELFLAADPRYVDDLSRDGFTRNGGKDYLFGRLAIIVPRGSPLAPDGTLEDLRAGLADGRVRRFAIANPEHAPYGRHAEEVLRRTGLWVAIRHHLVFGENVGQATQFAVSGNAEGGIIGLALARAPAIAARSSAAAISQQWHRPLRHRAVLLKGAGRIAERFYDHLESRSARELFLRHGFALRARGD